MIYFVKAATDKLPAGSVDQMVMLFDGSVDTLKNYLQQHGVLDPQHYKFFDLSSFKHDKPAVVIKTAVPEPVVQVKTSEEPSTDVHDNIDTSDDQEVEYDQICG